LLKARGGRRPGPARCGLQPISCRTPVFAPGDNGPIAPLGPSLNPQGLIDLFQGCGQRFAAGGYLLHGLEQVGDEAQPRHAGKGRVIQGHFFSGSWGQSNCLLTIYRHQTAGYQLIQGV
jgi:hypothetical protein